MKKIVVFSGAGLDRESGVLTFRDCKDGLWNNYKIDEVATPEGWKNDKEKVLQFYNERRQQLPDVHPNEAHISLVSLETEYEVIHITQNVSDLLERAGASNVIHLHGELTKARSSFYESFNIPLDEVIDIGYNDIKLGDKCEKRGSQLRPHIVWFKEYPLGVNEAYRAVEKADILLIVGTSLQISYTLDMLSNVRRIGDEQHGGGSPCEIYFVDPKPMRYLDNYGLTVNYIEKPAVEGIGELVKNLLIQASGGVEKNV
jgi:NAD-dependent deacetylase